MILDSKKYNGPCSCGRDHGMETKLVVIEAGCLKDFSMYMEKVQLSGKIATIYDQNTYSAKNIVRPAASQEIILDPENLHADEKATEKVMSQLDSDIEILVAMGSGTVHDITRFCANEREIYFVSCPTAATVDGFCSTVSAMTWYGFKKTLPGVAPILVLADLDVISQAPQHLALAGVGDIIGKYTALADWKISAAVTGEFFCSTIEEMTRKAVETVYKSSRSLSSGVISAYEELIYGLLLSGLAMQLMGNSRPASGAEHHISHLIEMQPEGLGAHSDAMHGEKVGVGTVIASREYARLGDIEDIAPYIKEQKGIDEQYLKEFFGERLIEAVMEENAGNCLAEVTSKALIENWQEVRKIIKDIPTADELLALYKEIGMKSTLEDIDVPESLTSKLLEYSPYVRNRLTFMRIRQMI